MKKIYIAGPDVFEPNSIEIGEKLVAMCRAYGFEGLYPLDNVVDFSQSKHKIAEDIFIANRAMIQDTDIVIANLNPFRGKEADSGTVWECGYAYGLGKEVYGYMADTKDYKELFTADEKQHINGNDYDTEGRLIEDFAYPLNLMIACSVKELVCGSFEDVLKKVAAKQ
ncbi:nucleoside 2-deoxyribosyltransferase [Sulfurimonas paralvinellae]|uniref:Nucleoside 2-deoxyribosyltransferase n=1 Tax=Sulfurimonas paralvinellae TaxID=317658 RepID=A0A7M1B9V1_9BACT|nr:nucleoside 2-deoxyribosyltransferase [Sulfurimonas paralvinellae]QOP45502.1 nucleoside 2-deoxyribosyltransferase [Sulfurimonas paralvinellae]